jgi:hypothetical protein
VEPNTPANSSQALTGMLALNIVGSL